ncbi:MAG TPA: ABC transporter substrate-binding protein [Aliidongia sp.]|uniref:ABC transporter substrate-binding protein n=1 Tax=Aliidongia sp. TaxID=1914230 RepID=UPI002DDDA8DA|nr:ABC transporter substrate-binding protein [Aliidongia sp.]HEV2677430.1 ABC transporter substrate-binding protein [Aliidongia sp.]
MRPDRRALLLALASAPLAFRVAQAAGAPVRIGVLRFGTVSWELEVIRRHGLDRAQGVALQPVEFAAAQATQVALQAGAVDMVALDWLWVSRQRSDGADWTFVPFSNAVGGLVAPAASPIRSVADLPGRKLGIAGSPLDKSWLILRAYAQRRHGIDLDMAVEKTFGAPPLLAEQLKAGRLDAMLTFWPFAAKAEAAGMRSVLAIDAAVDALGIANPVPVVGYVFSDRWAELNRAALGGFLAALARARAILATDDAEWQTLAPLTGAADDAELQRLKAWYRRGIPVHWGSAEQGAAAQLFQVLADIGGPALVGSAKSIAPGTFWPGTAF